MKIKLIRHRSRFFLALALAASAYVAAQASGSYLTSFENTYPSAVMSRIDSCLLCHTTSSGPALNSYGTAYANNGHSFTAIANLDSDGENALTAAIQEIRSRSGIAIVVAHRPSVLNAVDQVAMLNSGQLVAFGPKDEVLKKVLLHPVRAAVS